MKKFLKDLSEVGKDIWSGFVWVVEAMDNEGEIAGEKLGEKTKRKKEVKLMAANEEVRRNCVSWQ